MVRPYSYNPFLGPPPPDPGDPQTMMRQAAQDAMVQPRAAAAITPILGAFHGQGPLMSLQDHAALEMAPKLPVAGPPPLRPSDGTHVTIEAYPAQAGLPADHMFADYDDGATRYIYRGGDRVPWLHAQVDPAAQSPDYGKGERALYSTFLPGVTADQAVAPARIDAQQNNDAHRLYGYTVTNSNSLIGDFTQKQFGRRVGDARTWGYDKPLEPPGVDPIPPGMYRPTNPIW